MVEQAYTRQITDLHGSHPLRGNVTILFPGLQKHPSSDVASTSVSVMPPPLHAAHCTYSSALALLGSSSDVMNIFDGMGVDERPVENLVTNSRSCAKHDQKQMPRTKTT